MSYEEENENNDLIDHISSQYREILETKESTILSQIQTVLATGHGANDIPWKKCNLPSLRLLFRNCYNSKVLKKTGQLPLYRLRKQEIIDSIKVRIRQIRPLIRIQSLIRRFLVRCYVYYHGPGLLRRSLCTNDTDFATLAPVQELSHFHYFGIEESGTIYGFDIRSILLMAIKSKVKDRFEFPQNPYTRTKFPFAERFSKLITYMNLLFDAREQLTEFNEILKDRPEFHRTSLQQQPPPQQPPPQQPQQISDIMPTLYTPQERTPGYVFEHTYYYLLNNADVVNRNYFHSYREFFMRANISLIDRQYRNILELRRIPITARIQELFMEMDRYGHITNANWLSSLTINQLSTLMGCIVFLWNRMNHSAKMRTSPISPISVYIMSDINLNYVYNPYGQHITVDNGYIDYVQSSNPQQTWRDTETIVQNYNSMTASPEQQIELEMYHKMKYVLNFAECLTYGGYTREDRDLGIVNFLSALSEVSIPCRESMPWVYQNLDTSTYMVL